MIKEGDEDEPKVKTCARGDGIFSEEALVVFFKEDSVRLAVNLMDETELRLGDSSARMRVQQAEFSISNSKARVATEEKGRSWIGRKRQR